MKTILSILFFLFLTVQVQAQTLGIGGGSIVTVTKLCNPLQGVVNNFVGFETQEQEEAAGVSVFGVTYPTANPRSGYASLSLDGTRFYTVDWSVNVDGGNDYIVGVAIKPGDKTPTSNSDFLRIMDNTGFAIIKLNVATNGDVRIVNQPGSIIRTIIDPFVEGVYQFWEIYFQHSTTGTIEVLINGISQGEDTGQDLDSGNTFGGGASRFKVLGPVGITSHWEFDDLYILSGVNSVTDCFGNAEVFMYQNTVEDATDVGSTLDSGAWALVSETPGSPSCCSSDVGNVASYTTSSAIGGTATDEGVRSGPAGDPNVDGDSNIKAAKSVHRLKRGNGSGTNHVTRLGNNVDGMTNTSVVLGTDFNLGATYIALTESASIVPTSTEYFQIGFGRANAGGRDIIAGDQWAMLLHVPN